MTPAGVELLAGGMGGAAGILIGYPLDTVKARLQTHNAIGWESLSSLYRGMSLPLASAFGLNALLFFGYEMSLRQIRGDEESPTLAAIVGASMGGALVAIVPGVPVETVKTRLQVIYGNRVGPVRCVRDLVAAEGFCALYRGGAAMLARDLCGYPVYFGVYELLKHRIAAWRGREDATAQMIAGGMAGAASWWSICPLEILKNRRHVGGESLRRVATEIWRRDGLCGFFRGGAVMAVRAVPVNAATFVVYERVVEFME